MTLRPQFSLGVTGGDERVSAAHPAQGGRGLPAQFPSLGGDQVGDLMRLEMPPHVFDRIEFGRIGGQPLDWEAPLGGGHEVFDQKAAMDRRAIPEKKDFSGNLPLEMFQELNDLKTFDAAGMDLKQKPPQGQPADERKAFPVERLLQNRRLPSRGPGACASWSGAQPAFVNQDNGLALPARLFFNAGQTSRFQRAIAWSSRSMARRSGRWQLNPLAPSNRRTCPG